MFEKVKSSRFRISERVQFFDDACTICKNNDPIALKIQKQYGDLKESVMQLNLSFKKTEASIHTGKLAALDERRDKAIICLRKLADAYLDHHDEAKRGAAKLLLAAIDKYGKKISKLNYRAETSVLNNLVVDLQTEPELLAAVTLLGVGDTVEEIKAANDLFNTTYHERLGEDAEKDLIAASVLVEDCKEKYDILLKHIESRATIDEFGAYDTIVKQLNSLIEKFNTILAQREGRNQDDEDQL